MLLEARLPACGERARQGVLRRCSKQARLHCVMQQGAEGCWVSRNTVLSRTGTVGGEAAVPIHSSIFVFSLSLELSTNEISARQAKIRKGPIIVAFFFFFNTLAWPQMYQF